MSEITEKRQVYYIPDNYISESKLHIGQMTVRVRYLIDSLAMTAFLGVFAFTFIMLALPDAGVSAKLTVAVIICGPGFVLGQVGYNGDPISTTLKNLLKWRKNNEIRLYNTNPRLLGTDPIKALQEDAGGRDAMIEVYTNIWETMRRNAVEGEMVEGEDYEFRFDPGIDNYLEDNGDYSEEMVRDTPDVEISSEPDIGKIRFVFSSDGYNEPEEEDINISDYETN